MCGRLALVIPVKTVSERLPGKNFREIRGKQLWEIAVAKAVRVANHYDNLNCQVFISTDDHKKLAAEGSYTNWPTVCVLQRPIGLSDDWYDLMNWELDELGGQDFDTVAHIHCTAPFLHRETMQQVIEAITDGYDSAFTATEETLWPWMCEHGTYEPRYRTWPRLATSQEVGKTVLETHGMYAVRIKRYFEEGQRYPQPCCPVLVQNKAEAIDIDDESDLQLARAVAEGAGGYSL